jgi:4-diphosphocytidyl-2-C-methyl-D-erythritol kinase
LWRTGTTRTELQALAADLGSDVAFPLQGGTALGTGRGEQLTPVLATGQYHWVFAVSGVGISTADAYRELDRMRADGTAPDPIGAPDELLDALRAGDCGRMADALGNDLEAAALSLRPSLRDVLDAGAELGALGGVVSGSGPTVAFLCTHADAARDLADPDSHQPRPRRTHHLTHRPDAEAFGPNFLINTLCRRSAPPSVCALINGGSR